MTATENPGLHELGLLLPIERWLADAAPWEMGIFLRALLRLVEDELDDRGEHDAYRLVAASLAERTTAAATRKP